MLLWLVLRTAGPEFKFPTDRYPGLAASQLKRLNQFVKHAIIKQKVYQGACRDARCFSTSPAEQQVAITYLFVCLVGERETFFRIYARAQHWSKPSLHANNLNLLSVEFSNTSAFPAFKHVESALSLPLNTKLDDGDLTRSMFSPGLRAYAG